MSKEKIEWALYTNNETKGEEKIYFEDLNKEDYESKYKNNLTCINGCKSKIKFTHRKNNSKFFSTWNGEGTMHDEGCPFHVDYRGNIGRKKLKAYYEKREINDYDIKITLLNKIRGLKRNYNGEDKIKEHVYSKRVKNTGEMVVPGENAEGNYGDAISNKGRRIHNIMSIDARYLTTVYIGTRKCVYGIGSNAQINNKNGEDFGYINLKNRGYNVALYFSKAFYSLENGITLDDFKRLFNILKKEITDKSEDIVIVCYGEIKRKEKGGVNVNIINEKHIFINDMSIRQILAEGKIKNIAYKVV